MWKGDRYTINRKGLRDRDVSYEKPPRVRRVMMVGDSVVWGYKVGDGETFSDHLEAALPDTDVINLGVSGYGLGEDYLLLKEEGLRYHPDLVVLVFCMGNDVEDTYFPDSGDNYPANMFYLQDGALGVKRFHLMPWQRLGIALNERSYVMNFLLKYVLMDKEKRTIRTSSFAETMNRRALVSIQTDEATFGDLGYLRVDPPPDPEHVADRYRLLAPTPASYYKVALAKQLVLEMAAVVRSAGAEFLVVLSPFNGQLVAASPYYRNPLHAELSRFLRVAEIPLVDLLALFREQGDDPDRLFLDKIGHYSVWGHQRVAELLKGKIALGDVRHRNPERQAD
jgi:lysophospholipase L1-like esterase